MARIHIELPEHFIFATEVPLYISHINHGNHLDNALLLTIVSEARARLYASLGYTERDVEGLGMLMADAALQYKSEGFYGDVMVVEMMPTEWHDKGFDLVWRMSNKATGREVARGKSGMLFFDFTLGKVQPVPKAFINRIMKGT